MKQYGWYSIDQGSRENKNRTSVKNGLSCKVGLLGFEPRKTESKSVVLPLHHNPITFFAYAQNLECKNKVSGLFSQKEFELFR